MEPAHAPLPTCWNLPFQLLSGSHSSLLMSESDEGVSINCTRQNAGRRVIGFGASLPAAAGGVNCPPATAVAAMTFAFVSFNDAARVSHIAAPATPGTASTHETMARILMTRILSVVRQEMRDLRPGAGGISRTARC